MIKKNVFRKSLVIGLIILFIGASVTPNILVRNAKADSSNVLFSDNFNDNTKDYRGF